MQELQLFDTHPVTQWEREAPRDLGYYALRVHSAWNHTIQSIVGMGFLLAEARMQLTGIGWRRLIEEHCPFDLTVACRLMRIAEDQRITDPQIQSQLPASWHKLSELVQLDEETFRGGLETGAIHPAMSSKDVEQLRKSRPRESDSQIELLPPPEAVPLDEELKDRLMELLSEFPNVKQVSVEFEDRGPVRITRGLTGFHWMV